LAILARSNLKMLRKQDLPATLFFAITIISAATLIVPLWNYTQYYSALYNFNYTIQGITVNTSQLSARMAQINFTLVATNPTPYSGLQVGPAQCEIDFFGSIHPDTNGQPTTYWELTKLYNTTTCPIGPNSNLTIPFGTTINPDNTKLSSDQYAAFQEFMNYLTSLDPKGEITLVLICHLGLQSFMVSLDILPVGGNPFMQDIPLSQSTT